MIEFAVQFFIIAIMVAYITITFMNRSITETARFHHLHDTFYYLAAVAFALTTLLSARHIHLNSMQVEELGIRTNSTLMKVYVVFWLVLTFCVLTHYSIMSWYFKIMDRRGWDKDMNQRQWRLRMAEDIDICILNFISCSLEIMILGAYFRLTKKYSAEATELVTRTL